MVGVHQGQPMTAPWRAVGLFLLLTICLSGIFWVLINATQTVNAAYIFGLIWMPRFSPAASWAGRFARLYWGPGTADMC